ncbi:MAG: DUF4293 domain-containing protein [Cyclobacteriaceae bacterium]|nr:DUF4293 domain-containing protein [Cyclobacteriaceae bacterium]MCX7637581.1 DUF4293 domain-containing protein [Cyclobacteriaceae bacterium]MDW8330710.1 DUF4293 domain-containing protein [Cyclobacteriaceae bacterium]
MWQRPQTVFLILNILALLVALIKPIWALHADEVLTPFYLKRGEDFIYMPYAITAALAVASITLAVMIIRRYTNRMLQLKLGALNSVMLAGFMVCAVWFANKLMEGGRGKVSVWWVLLAAVAVLSNWLAMKFIRRDERIVRESDRIR